MVNQLSKLANSQSENTDAQPVAADEPPVPTDSAIESLDQQWAFWKCLLASVLSYGLMALVISPAWEDTDDFRMSMISAAIDDSGETTELLVYINVVVGHGLAQLYAWVPSVPWYSTLFLNIQVVAQATIFYALSRMLPRRLLLGVVQFTMAAYFWTHFQFTTTAAVATLAGATLLFETIRSQGSRRQLFGAWLLIVLGTLVRLQSAGLVGLLTLPAFGAFAWRHRASLQWCRQLGFAAVALTTVAVCLHLDSKAYENEPGWKEFRSVSRPVALVVNNVQHMLQIYNKQAGDDLVKAIEQTGMTRAEQEAMCIWLYSPPDDTYSAKKVSAASNALAEHKDQRKLPRFVVVSIVTLVKDNLFVLLLFVSFTCVGSLAVQTHDPEQEDPDSSFRWGGFFLQWLLFLGLMTFIHWNMKLPPRVYISAALTTLVVTAVLASKRSSEQASPTSFSKMNNVLTILCLLGSGWLVVEQAQHSRMYVSERDLVKADLQQQLEKDGPPVVITVPYPFDRLHPFDNLSWMRGLSYVYLDGHQLSPRQRQITQPKFYISNKSRSLGAKKHLDRQFGALVKLKQSQFGSVYVIAPLPNADR